MNQKVEKVRNSEGQSALKRNGTGAGNMHQKPTEDSKRFSPCPLIERNQYPYLWLTNILVEKDFSQKEKNK